MHVVEQGSIELEISAERVFYPQSLISKESLTFVFSFRPPCWHWHPKNFFRGSWQILSLRKHLTPGMEMRTGTSSTNDFTGSEQHSKKKKQLRQLSKLIKQ